MVSLGFGQVTVSNPANTTPNLAATYTSLANAITALGGITSIGGPVIITLNSGNNETAPAGGYVIQFTASTTATNNIIIEGSGNTITAFSPQAAGSINDAIFKLIGADYITIRDFIMQENPANTVNTPAASNNMTEWGIALLRATTTDGSQNNTIQNNTISLNRTYRNSFGIYSNARHAPAAPTTATDATAVSGSNLGNKVYTNTISNVMMGIAFIGTATAAFQDSGNDIGGSSAATGNTITNWGGNTALSSYASNLSGSACIYSNHQVADNISYNTINSGLVGTGVSVAAFSGIRKNYTTSPVGTFTSTISYNTITMTSDFSGGVFDCIRSQGMAVLPTATINITNNNLINNSISAVVTSMGFNGILNDSSPGVLNISDNVIRGFNAVSLNTFIAINQNGAVVNIIDINNNKIGDAIAGALTSNVSSNGNLYGIANGGGSSTAVVNVNNNSMDGFSIVNAGFIGFINNTATAAVANINNNRFGTATGNLISFSGVQPFNTDVIFNGSFASSSLSIQNNDIRGMVNSVTSSATTTFINCSAPSLLSTNISNNTFTNLSINSSGQVTLISRGSNLVAGSVVTIGNNSIVGNFSKTAAGNSLTMYTSSSFSVSGSAINITGNNFSNVSMTGSTIFYGIRELDGASGANSPAKTISGNTISNITGSDFFFGLQVDKGPNFGITSNTISNVSTAGIIYGIYLVTNSGTTSLDVSSNTISTLNSTVEEVYGIRNTSTSTAVTIHKNKITGLSTSGSNKMVNGMLFSNGTVTAYNNFVAGLQAGNASLADAVRGISVNSSTAGTAYNLYYNSIYLNANSAGANFGTSGIYHLTNATATTAALKMIGNIIVNTSTANGTGITAAYRRSDATLTNFAAASNYNLFYAGTPSATNLIFYDGTNSDQTLAAYKTRISPRDANSISTMPYFVSATDLHLITDANCAIEDAGNNTGALILTDIDGDTRNVFPTDIGADEVDGSFILSLVVPPAVCFPNTVNLTAAVGGGSSTSSPGAPATVSYWEDAAATIPIQPIHGTPTAITTSGTYYIKLEKGTCYAISSVPVTINGTGNSLAGITGGSIACSNGPVGTGAYYLDGSCNLIARVVPSGASPVAGMINSCVIIDGTQQYFNGEPYVQRHYDIEPANSPAAATATITLYYTDAEFINYNTLNPVWPKFPTSALGNADPDRANVRITQFHGTPMGGLPTSTPSNYTGTRELIDPGAANVNWNGNYWAVTFPVSGFSGFYVHTTIYNTPLPITINYFNGIKLGNHHLLDWKLSCNSTPGITITLERSADSRNFNGLSTITADAVRCNQPFNHTDTDPLKGMNYYRLKVTDAAGKISYSGIVALLNAIKGFDIVSMTPNPVITGSFKLNVASTQSSKMQLMVFDIQGRILNRQTVSVIAGYNSIPVNVDDLASGIYSIQCSIGEDKSETLRFVKQ